MICTEIWNGSGIGNQLHLYVTTRCIALDNGYEWGIMHWERFKGRGFMDLDFGKEIRGGATQVEGKPPVIFPEGITSYYWEKYEPNGQYDEYLKHIPDNTKIDGVMQGEKYIEHRRDEIKNWLKVEPVEIPDDVCVINFRGGEYKYVPEFHLTKDYWDRGIAIMKFINPDMKFEVHTDDPEEARKFFPDYPIVSDISLNWRNVRYAQYLLISNSSFAWLPAWLGDAKLIIAPKFWGRRNKGYWHLEQNYTKRFLYI